MDRSGKGTQPLQPLTPRAEDDTMPDDLELGERIQQLVESTRFDEGEDEHAGDLSPEALLAEIRRKEENGEPLDTRELRMLPTLATDIQPWRVLFQTMVPDPKVLGVDISDVAVVGRSELGSDIVPDLDLAPFGAQSMGVSRRHAILLPHDDGLSLIDLDSTNGTWINGVYLQPGQKYRLRAGDRVEFGRLRLVIRVLGAMLQGGTGQDSTAVTRSKPKRR